MFVLGTQLCKSLHVAFFALLIIAQHSNIQGQAKTINHISTLSANEILIVFYRNVTLNGVLGTDFTVAGAASNPTVSLVGRFNDAITSLRLTLSADIVEGETITLSYTGTTSSIVNFTNREVLNLVQPDTTPPVVTGGRNDRREVTNIVSASNPSTGHVSISVITTTPQAVNTAPFMLSGTALQDKSGYICSRISNVATTSRVYRYKGRSIEGDCVTYISDWNSYSRSQLINKLKGTTNFNCFLDFFKLGSTDTYEVLFSNANIQAVALEMNQISTSHNGTLNSGAYGLLIYLHAAIYQEFGQKTISLNSESKNLLFNAMESFADNEHLWNVDEIALRILHEYLIICDYKGLRHKKKIISVVKKAIKKLIYEDNWKLIVDDRVLIEYGSTYNKVLFLLFRGVANRDPDYISAAHKDDELIELLYLFSKDDELLANEHLKFLVDNAVLELTRMATSSELRPDVEGYIADLVPMYTRLTPSWFHLIGAINKGDNCEAYNLCKNMEDIRKEIENMLFPNTWIFDDGKLKVKTPLPYDKTQTLYYATKQVQSQFFRFLQTDSFIPDDSNIELNMVIYGTLKEYKKWNTILNNLSTNNGGIYIEKKSTLYTYERTSEESMLSLEELLRHEYVHYLQGRYIENGYWGETDFYKDNRLVWFDEGMAEYFTGSTDDEGVRIRQSQGNALKADGEDEYMTVSEILSADYSEGFKFYRYSNALWSYWSKYDMATAKELINLVKNDDIQGYDSKIAQLKKDSALQTNYKNYLNNFVINTDNWWNVNTPSVADKLFNISDVENLKYEFNKTTGIDAEVSLDATNSIRRFRATFPITITDNETFNTKLDTIIAKLKRNLLVNNFHYISGYYTNVSSNDATAIIAGSLLKQGVSNNPHAQFSANHTHVFEGDSIVFSNLSTGYIRDYKWLFSGSNTSISTEVNPIITYDREGSYTVILKAIRDSLQDIESKLEFIHVYERSDLTYCYASVRVVDDYIYISNVSFAGINNESTISTENGYSDYTNLLAVVSGGLNYNFSVSVDSSEEDEHNRTKVWIDWNQDGDFKDENEDVLLYVQGETNSRISVPVDALEGVTRMRVRYSFNDIHQKCGINDYIGEVEDYSVLVDHDTDNDGIFNNIDQCNNTTSGDNVNAIGCAQISSNNFEISSTTPSCPNINNGKISIKNSSSHMFNFVVTGPNSYNKTFENKLANQPFVIENLAVGMYNITAKFSTDGIGKDIPGFQVAVNGATPVSGTNKSVNKLKKSSVFTVSGDKKYSIFVNDVFQRDETFSDESEYDIVVENLSTGKNHIKIIPENICRGLIEDWITIRNSNIKFYPNPAVDLFHIVGLESSDINVTVFAYNGQLVYNKKHKSVNGIVYFSIRDLPTGLYIVRVSGKKAGDNINFKITKK